MKLSDSYYKKYAQEYINYGKNLGFFNYIQAQEISKEISNLNVVENSTLPGDAMINTAENTLYINPNRCVNEEKLSLVLFHEFTHLNSSMHKDIHSEKSFIKSLKSNANSIMEGNTHYDYYFSKTEINDVNNPFTYILWGGLLLDEVIAENVATEMAKIKFNKTIPLKNKQKQYGNNIVNYRTHFDYYGIGEEICNKFAQTLFGCKNLHDLSRENFKPDFVKNLIRQHNERPDALQDLAKELGLMGVIAFAEEQAEGRCLDREKPSPNFIWMCYKDLDPILANGRENRETIPNGIPMPDFC